ncbi:alanine racemase [Pseudoxanthomonas indica]|uniref:Alanine racemase n=1 Tax=Pseudoxanthomonas indica TaxID=428993 RepID=A0A1T5KQP4_9GAMM|nr:alanine racemase [Pseudoxanthomonas indica]GGD50786.1 alanine racemase [Pseudoxanthomonas indica]SKC65973.1 alanine racemase [Pseudoxanthomonas indica]
MRPARALIDLPALRHNYRLARQLAGGRALAVVKADAYGHGAVRCAQALGADAADGFAVACLEEALALRDGGIRAPILLLEGFFEAAELPLIAQHNLWCVVHSHWQIDALERTPLPRPLRVWLKLDSGMHRVGLSPADYRAGWERLVALPQVDSLVAMTHFARADELDSARTDEQAQAFIATVAGLPGEHSVSNSPGLLGWPTLRNDWGRAGLMLYGATPFNTVQAQASQLQPVMTLESKIISVRELAAGEPIGYGGSFVTDRPTRVGVVALGYADGYPQFAPTGTPVSIDGQASRLIGRVSMDMLTVDLTDLPAAGLGSQVELWGRQVPVTEVARHLNGSAYSLLCGLKRAPRVYVE